MSWTLSGDFRYDYYGSPWIFKNELRAVYGRSKIGGGTYRTTDNDLYIETVASYDLGWAGQSLSFKFDQITSSKRI